MIVGTVRGDIVATIQHPFYNGQKLLIVEKENFEGKPGGYLIAMDSGVSAGVGERVLVIDEATPPAKSSPTPRPPSAPSSSV